MATTSSNDTRYSIKDVEKVVQTIEGKIKSTTVTKPTRPGDNFVTLVLQVDFDLEKNGKSRSVSATESVIAKRLPPLQQNREFAALGMKNEIKWYKEIMPIIKDFAGKNDLEVNYYADYMGSRFNMNPELTDELDDEAVLLLKNLKSEATFQKRLRREKRTRKRLQDQLDLEATRRAQLEEALRNAGAAEQLDTINEKLTQQQQQQQTPLKPPTPNQLLQLHHQQSSPLAVERLPERIKQEIEEPPQQFPREAPLQHHQENNSNNKAPTWGYSGLDLMSSGAAFWQNYSETLAQELEMERKSRLQQAERDVKSPLQDRTGYYKNSVMFTSSAT